MNKTDIAILSESEVSTDRDALPERFKILSYKSHILTQKGRQSTLDFTRDVADKIVAESERRGLDTPIDFDHATYLEAEKQGIEEQDLNDTPAVGWLKLTVDDEGLWAEVKSWSERAKTYLKDKGYKYFSPVIRGLQSGNYRLSSLALTNLPALDHQDPLVAKSETINPEGNDMEILGKLAKILGVDVVALTEAGTDVEATVLGKVSALISLTKENPDAIALQAEIQELKNKLEKKERDSVIARGLKEGKLTKSLIEGALKDASAVFLTSYLSDAPVLVPLGKEVEATDLVSDEKLETTQADKFAIGCGNKKRN